MQDKNVFKRGMNSFSRTYKYSIANDDYKLMQNKNDFITIGAVRVVLKKAI